MSPEPMLRYRDATFRHGELVAVDGLDLAVEPGEMFGLIGPDGAGKTTSLRLALGLLEPDEGSVRTCGLDPIADHRELSERVGYLSQRFSLYGDLTVDENVAFFARIHGVRGWTERRDELLGLVRMDPFRRRLADRLSGGMKQKLSLACTLIHRPDLLVLDEPTTGVDPVSRRDFWKLLARLQREGLTLVMTTPYLDEAERCQRVALMHRGRLLAVDDPRRLRDGFPGGVLEITARPSGAAAEILRDRPGVDQVEAFGERLRVFIEKTDAETAERRARELERALVEAGVEVRTCRPRPPSLEDVFIAEITTEESRREAELRTREVGS